MLNEKEIAKVLTSFQGNNNRIANKIRSAVGQGELPPTFFVDPNIPGELMTIARKKFKLDSNEKIIGLINDSFVAKKFTLFTNRAIYGHISPFPFVTLHKSVPYEELKKHIPKKALLNPEVVLTDKVRFDIDGIPDATFVNMVNALRGLVIAKS